MKHNCSIVSTCGREFFCVEKGSGHFVVLGYRVNYCPFCGAKAPKEGIPAKYICHSDKDEDAIWASFENDDIDNSFQEYCDTVDDH